MNKKRNLNVVLWLARILGSIVILFLLFMTIGELFTNISTTTISTSDTVALLLFPGSTVLGLLLAFKWKALGGLITVGGMICLHILRPDLASSFLISTFAIPGLLYIIHAVWSIK